MILMDSGKRNNKRKITKKLLLFFVFILSTKIAFLGVQWFFNNSGNFLSENAKASFYGDSQSDILNQPVKKEITNQQTEDLTVNAESVISVKIRSIFFNQILESETLKNKEKVLFSKNENERLPIASLVKLMTALVVFENYNLSQKATVNELAMTQEGEQGNLKAGEILSVKNLLYITLIESSNKAAYALSEVVGTDRFIYLMNYTAQKMGLINTHFKDSTGLDSTSYSTSEDLAKLSKHLFENYPLFREIISLKEFDLYLDDGKLHHKLINTNKFLGEVAGVIGGKTGWTKIAKGCFMIIQESHQTGNYFINVILGAEDRFLEMQKLINLVNPIR